MYQSFGSKYVNVNPPSLRRISSTSSCVDLRLLNVASAVHFSLTYPTLLRDVNCFNDWARVTLNPKLTAAWNRSQNFSLTDFNCTILFSSLVDVPLSLTTLT